MKIIIRQISKYKWRLESVNGNIILEDLSFHNAEAANIYIKNYISSFTNWQYEVKALK